LPIGIVITPGQAHDVTAFPAPTHYDPEHMFADKGDDTTAVRQEIEKRGGKPQSPPPQAAQYNEPSAKPSTPGAIGSSGSSIV